MLDGASRGFREPDHPAAYAIGSKFVRCQFREGPSIDPSFEPIYSRIALFINSAKVIEAAADGTGVVYDAPLQQKRRQQFPAPQIRSTQQINCRVTAITTKVSRNKFLAIPRQVQNQLLIGWRPQLNAPKELGILVRHEAFPRGTLQKQAVKTLEILQFD